MRVGIEQEREEAQRQVHNNTRRRRDKCRHTIRDVIIQ